MSTQTGNLLQVWQFRQCRHGRGCQRTRLKVRQQQILLQRVILYSRTTPGRHQHIYYATQAYVAQEADHSHTQVCGAAKLLTDIFFYGDCYAMVQIKTLAPNTQGPSLPQTHPQGEFSTFPFSCREGQAWEGQVLPWTRANIFKKVKAQPPGFRKWMQQWPRCFRDAKTKTEDNLVNIDYYITHSVCCLSNKLLKQIHWLPNCTCRNSKHQKYTKTLLMFQFFKVSRHLSCYESSRAFSCIYPTENLSPVKPERILLLIRMKPRFPLLHTTYVSIDLLNT